MDHNSEVVAKWPPHMNQEHEHPCPVKKQNKTKKTLYNLILKAQISCNVIISIHLLHEDQEC